MTLLILILVSSPVFACRALPVNYQDQVDKKIAQFLKEKGLAPEATKRNSGKVSVTGKSKTSCRQFEFATGIEPHCEATIRVLKENPCAD